MKQLLQRLDTGVTSLVEVSAPSVSGVYLLVQTQATVVSAGTERMLVEFGRANLLEKARKQPEKVRDVIGKLGTDGIGPTMEAVRSKLETPITLGYSQAGIVAGVGPRAGNFAVGDRVVTNGPHAEYVRVPHTLAAKIPDGVSFEAAAFTPIAAQIVEVDTPGLTTPHLERFDFRHIPRPIYPLDGDFPWQPPE